MSLNSQDLQPRAGLMLSSPKLNAAKLLCTPLRAAGMRPWGGAIGQGRADEARCCIKPSNDQWVEVITEERLQRALHSHCNLRDGASSIGLQLCHRALRVRVPHRGLAPFGLLVWRPRQECDLRLHRRRRRKRRPHHRHAPGRAAERPRRRRRGRHFLRARQWQPESGARLRQHMDLQGQRRLAASDRLGLRDHTPNRECAHELQRAKLGS